jgi:hypothetical protein
VIEAHLRNLPRDDVTASCGEVNDLIGRLLGEALPTVHFAHRDLARSQQSPEQRNVSTTLKHPVFEFKLGFLAFGLAGLIQAAVGLSGGSGGFLTKRSGLHWKARSRLSQSSAFAPPIEASR